MALYVHAEPRQQETQVAFPGIIRIRHTGMVYIFANEAHTTHLLDHEHFLLRANALVDDEFVQILIFSVTHLMSSTRA